MVNNVKKSKTQPSIKQLLPKHPKHYHRAYRIRHVSLVFVGVGIMVLSVFILGFVLGKESDPPVVSQETYLQKPATNMSSARSSLGFRFAYDASALAVAATEIDPAGKASAVSPAGLSENKKITELSVKTKKNTSRAPGAVARLSIETRADTKDFDNFKKRNAGLTEPDAAAEFFGLKTTADYEVVQVSRGQDVLGSLQVTKTVYKESLRSGAQLSSVYTILWTGVIEGRPIKVAMQGLSGGETIPANFAVIFDTLQLGTNTAGSLERLSSSVSAQSARDFDVNAYSPAVVKLYHIICGNLVINDQKSNETTCTGDTGSGFLVSSDGYIATNGHVIIYDAADIVVNELINNPLQLQGFLGVLGLSPQQISTIGKRPELLAATLAKIYDLPPEKLRLDNKREITLAALGDTPVDIESGEDALKILDQKDTHYIKRAEVLATDYAARDLLILQQGAEDGFSASDVALLKINTKNAPYIGLADSSRIQQNARITVVGFPGDAENQLTQGSKLVPTVTNGSISSIRQASGSKSKLFQSDADASQGNSGGPAIDEDGRAFGLMTYRYKDPTAANAAKSYIRDIEDFKKLLASKKITLNTSSTSQQAWEKGLVLYGDSKFSAAISEFKKVRGAYPAHRLVDTYTAGAQDGIKQGKDVKEPSLLMIGLIGALTIGGGTAATGLFLFGRHRGYHLLYKLTDGQHPKFALQPAVVPHNSEIRHFHQDSPVGETFHPVSEIQDNRQN